MRRGIRRLILQIGPTDEEIVVEDILQSGRALHHLDRLTEAEEIYVKLGYRLPLTLGNLAVVYHAQGRSVEAFKAMELYDSRSDVGLMNSYGAMLQVVGFHQEAGM